MLTTATRSDPTPLPIGHAGMSVGSFQGVPSVTGVGHCGPKGCTRATSPTICRSIGGRTTDTCREDTVTTFLVAIYKGKHMPFNAKLRACKYLHMQSYKQSIIIIIYKTTHRYACACIIHIYTGMMHVNTCI